MARKRSPYLQRMEYAAVRGVTFLLRILPLGAAAAFGRGLTWLLQRFDRRHRERCVDQMMAALGGSLPRREVMAVVRDMYRHLGIMLAEFVRIPTLTIEDTDRLVEWDGNDVRIREMLARGKGAIFATGHVGNWEVCGAVFALKGFSSGAVARPLDNPYLDRYVKSVRQSRGQRIWDKFGVLRRLVKTLKNGEGFGILVDQDAGQRGLFVPFFGIEASTIPTHADLALLTGAPIMAVGFHRIGGPMRFTVRCGPPRWPDPAADKEQERHRLLALVNADLEAIIRRDPSQWLWLHRRWKTRPPAELSPKPAAVP